METIFIPSGKPFTIESNERGTYISIPKNILKNEGSNNLEIKIVGNNPIKSNLLLNALERYGRVEINKISDDTYMAKYSSKEDEDIAFKDLQHREVNGNILFIKRVSSPKNFTTLELEFEGGKSSSISSQDMLDILQRYGKVYVVRSGNNKFFANFDDHRDAADAYRDLKGRTLDGKAFSIHIQ